MSAVKHTPGPWVAFYKAKYDEWHVSVPIAGSSMKWALFDDGIRSENPEADARLIAAAPELLEALRAIETAAENDSDCLPESATWKAINAARAAIAKAGGAA